MGIGGLSVGSLLLVLVIVMLLFGTKRLRNIGTDIGEALSGFRKAVREQEGGQQEPLGMDAQPSILANPALRDEVHR